MSLAQLVERSLGRLDVGVGLTGRREKREIKERASGRSRTAVGKVGYLSDESKVSDPFRSAAVC